MRIGVRRIKAGLGVWTLLVGATLSLPSTAVAASGPADPPTTVEATSGAHPGTGLSTSTAKAKQRAKKTEAVLEVTTTAARVKHRVKVSLDGSHVGRHRRVASVLLDWGDGEVTSLKRIRDKSSHRYEKPGTYRIRLKIKDSAGKASVAKRPVVVSGKKDVAVFRPQVDRLPAARLLGVTPLSATTESLLVSAGSPAPAVGRVLVFPSTTSAPSGLVGVVDAVAPQPDGSSVVTVHDGGIPDVYSKLAIATSSEVGKQVVLSRVTESGRVEQMLVRASAVPLTCTASTSKPISLTADFSKTQVGAVLNPTAKIFSFSVISYPVISLNATLGGSVSCQLNGGFSLNFPVPAVPGLLVTVGPYFKFAATGQVSASINWKPKVILNVVRSPKYDDTFLRFYNSADLTAGGQATVTLSGGFKVGVSMAKAVGIEASVGPKISVSASASPGQSCVDGTAMVEAQVRLYANVFFASPDRTLWSGEYWPTNFLHKCSAGSGGASGGGSATGGGSGGSGSSTGSTGGSTGGAVGYVGPVRNETTGSTARTWTDYVHAGGTEGPTIGVNQTVGIACRAVGFRVADGNTWWYRIASSPWNGSFYVSADAFYNNGQTSGPLRGTPFVDESVPVCQTSAGSAPTPTTPPSTPTPTSGGTWTETTGSVAHTWTNWTNAGGTEGPVIGSNQQVQISCRLTGFRVANGNTWWYRIASSPWNNAYYVSADAFYNNGQTTGSLRGTPFVDQAVPECGSSSGGGAPAGGSRAETAGSVAHTWTNWTNAGGTEGPTIARYQTVQIRCKLSGFRVANGNTWWYRIAESPWNDQFYVSADAFYNNGATSGPLAGTPYVDPAVPDC